MSATDTRLALTKARAGVPPSTFAELDPDELDTFLAEYGTTVVRSMPRAVRRAGRDEVLFDGVQNAMRWAFWLAAAYVVQRDQET